MYLVASDTKLTIELFQIETNKIIARYYYESDFDYSLGLEALLNLLVDS